MIWCGWWAKDHNGLVEDKIEVGVKRTRYRPFVFLIFTFEIYACQQEGSYIDRAGSRHQRPTRRGINWSRQQAPVVHQKKDELVPTAGSRGPPEEG